MEEIDEPIAKPKSQKTHPSVWAAVAGKWPAFVVEIFIIIIGISISFYIEERRQESSTRELELVYLRKFAEDLDEDIKNLNALIAKSQASVESSKRLLALAESNGQEVDKEQFSVDFNNMLETPAFICANATFSELRSGNSYVVRDASLLSSLFKYYLFVEMITEQQQREFNDVTTHHQPYLYSHYYILKGKILSNDDTWKTVHDKMFLNILNGRIWAREGLIPMYEQAAAHATAIRNSLTQE